MNVTAIIAEYNPCHKGHIYHIRKTRELTKPDCLIVVMSGNYVQRGIPAIFDKYTRAHSAVLAGADLVLELPVIYSTASAEFFAENSVKILKNLGNVSNLSFGVENDDKKILSEIADILINEPDEFRKMLKKYVREGNSVATARAKALSVIDERAEKIISSPNNILAIEYIKAIKKNNANIAHFGIKRIGNGYNDPVATTEYPSATAIRNMYHNKELDAVKSGMSDEIFNYIKDKRPLSENDFNVVLNQALLKNAGNFDSFFDVDEKIANRIDNIIKKGTFYNYNELAMLLKTRNYTYTRICRILSHIMLGIGKDDITEPSYCRVLAFNDAGSRYIKETKKSGNNMLFTDIKQIKNTLSGRALRSLEKDIYASDIYRMIMYEKHGMIIPDEFRHKPEIL